MDNFIFNMFGMLVLFMFLVIIGGGISQWVKNNNSPKETVKARVVDKKSEVTYIQQEQNGMTNTPQWSYYIVFEFENSDGKKVVKKMVVSGKEYKRICEGDCGDLTFQGTRYIGFER